MTHKDLPPAKMETRYRILLLTILLSYVLIQTASIPLLPLTYDDGLNLQVSQLINRGYEPYTQIFTLSSPLFIWFIGWLGRFNLSPTGIKLIFLLFALLLLVNTSVITRALLGEKIALATVFLLATATTFLAEAAIAIVPVTPALSIATLSLLCVFRYLATKQMSWVFLGGLAWGVALILSLSALSTGLIGLIFIIFFGEGIDRTKKRPLDWQNSYKPVIVWLLGTGLILVIGLLLATPDIIFSHILRDYATIRENLSIAQDSNFILIGQFIVFNIWLFLFAAYGLVQIYEEPNHLLWLILIWALLSFGWLMLQVMLRLLDLAILLPPVAIMAGWGLVNIGYRLMRWSQRWQVSQVNRRLLLSALTIFFLIFFLWTSWQRVNSFNLREIDTPADLAQLEQRSEIINFIHHHTTSEDCVIIDDTALAVAANRLPPPQLVGLSREQILGRLLDIDIVKKVIQEHRCKAVVFSKRKYTQPLSDFSDWVREYYPNQQEFIRTKIYYQ